MEHEIDQSTTPENEPMTANAPTKRIRIGPDFHRKLQQWKTRHSGAGEQRDDDHQAPRLDLKGQPVIQADDVPSRRSPAALQTQLHAPADVVVDDWTPAEDYDEDIAEPQPGPSQAPHSPVHIAASQERIQKYQAKKRQDKENRQSQAARPRAFIDRQEEAERIEFDDTSQQRRSQPILPRRLGLVSRGKRPAPVEEDEEYADEDVSQDEGFQTDSRDAGNRSQRRPQTSTVPSSNARTIQPPPTKSARTTSRTTRPSSSRVQRGSSPDVEPEEDDNQTSTSHTQVKALAKQNTALARMTTGQRKRKAWTVAEEMQLQTLIADYGTSWTELKKMDETGEQLLVDRDQVALKDKARNMKMAFLK